MYQIEYNGNILHHDNSETLRLYGIDLEIEANQLGALNFTIYNDHKYYNTLNKLKSVIKVKRENKTIFKGRILDYDAGFQNQWQVVCEGSLAFLLDTVVRPYNETEDTVSYLTRLINNHNAQINDNEKTFKLGTVSDKLNVSINRTSSKYPTTWADINEKLVGKYGGYLIVEYGTNDECILNYITEDDFRLSNQKINFGDNLLDLKVNSKGAEIITAIIPLGGTEEAETRIDISTYPDGIIQETAEGDVIRKTGDYIYSEEAVNRYGFIVKSIIYEDITEDVGQLVAKAVEELNVTKKSIESIELSAIDLSKLGLNINAFSIGTMVSVTSTKHGYDKMLFPITKLSLNLLNPTSNKLILQKTYATFTEKSASNSVVQNQGSTRIENVENNVVGLDKKIIANQKAIAETTEELTSMVNQTSEEILVQVSEKHYLKDETNALVSNIETQIKQTNDQIEFRFNTFNQNVEDLQAGNDAQFQNISKYIRFKDGNILLGEEGNELILKIQNDRISFLESDTEVAYFSNRKLYVLDGEFLNQLRLGNFAFIPRTNGNVSFKRIN